MRIAQTQMNTVWEDRDANLAICERLIAEASMMRCDAIVFPEMCLTGFSMNPKSTAERQHGRSMEILASLARKSEIHVIFGDSVEIDELYFNMLYVLDAHGQLVYSYKKIHPFSLSNENHFFEAGDSLGVFSIREMRFGAAICYDLRFPEVFTRMANHCDGFLVIGNWPAARIEHWNLLVRARAIDSLAFVLATNRIGAGGGLDYVASTQVVGPWAEILSPIESREIGAAGSILVWDIDPSTVQRRRESFSLLKDRREFKLQMEIKS